MTASNFEFPIWPQPDQSLPAIGSARARALRLVSLTDVVGLTPNWDDPAALTAPEPLSAWLFGKADPQNADHTMGAAWAILDAAVIPNLAEMLEASDLPHRCLYIGEAYEELKSVAPWLVRIGEGNPFARNLFTHDTEDPAPWHAWTSEPGIYIRSSADIDALHAHFRKFTKLRHDNGGWYYFRFWEPRHLTALLAKHTGSGRLNAMFYVPGHNTSCLFVIPQTDKTTIARAEWPPEGQARALRLDDALYADIIENVRQMRREKQKPNRSGGTPYAAT